MLRFGEDFCQELWKTGLKSSEKCTELILWGLKWGNPAVLAGHTNGKWITLLLFNMVSLK